VEGATAEEVAKLFVECIAAPLVLPAARKEIFAAKKNLRLLELPPGGLEPERELQLKRVLGGILVQAAGPSAEIKDHELRTVTKRVPTAEEMQDHALRVESGEAREVQRYRVCKGRRHAGALAAGQMSRVDSVKTRRDESTVFAGRFRWWLPTLSSPFPTEWKKPPKPGATAVIQPGGSVRDPDVIAAADRLALAMVFTGMRHFLH